MSVERGGSKKFSGIKSYLVGLGAVIASITALIVGIAQLRDVWCSKFGLLCSAPPIEVKADFANVRPVLISPDDGAAFDKFPRTIDLVWQVVPGAAAYQLETQIQVDGPVAHSVKWVPLHNTTVTQNHVIIEFGGATWGRWRVSAVRSLEMKAKSPTGERSISLNKTDSTTLLSKRSRIE
jgi:hypothetical protein